MVLRSCKKSMKIFNSESLISLETVVSSNHLPEESFHRMKLQPHLFLCFRYRYMIACLDSTSAPQRQFQQENHFRKVLSHHVLIFSTISVVLSITEFMYVSAFISPDCTDVNLPPFLQLISRCNPFHRNFLNISINLMP